MTPKQEARLIGRAIKSRWPVRDEIKVDVIETLHQIAETGDKESTRVAACNALLAAESQNQKDEHSNLNDLRERIFEIATQFGIDLPVSGVVGVIGNGTNGSNQPPDVSDEE